MRKRKTRPAPCPPRVPLTPEQLFVIRIRLDWGMATERTCHE